ncbi:MAG: hypothetical protein KI788_09870, partial [Mameliella sp.]|nr:hypothetical protein [Mameliella sp.]
MNLLGFLLRKRIPLSDFLQSVDGRQLIEMGRMYGGEFIIRQFSDNDERRRLGSGLVLPQSQKMTVAAR